MSGHTKGPWDIKEYDNDKVMPTITILGKTKRGGNVYVAKADFMQDARLIAAAPELLEACKDLICAVNIARQEQHTRSFGDDLRTDAYNETADQMAAKVAGIIDNARAAIAAAEGRE